jgi:hypothetical protein
MAQAAKADLYLPIATGSGVDVIASDISYGRTESIERVGNWIEIVCESGMPTVNNEGEEFYVFCR